MSPVYGKPHLQCIAFPYRKHYLAKNCIGNRDFLTLWSSELLPLRLDLEMMIDESVVDLGGDFSDGGSLVRSTVWHRILDDLLKLFALFCRQFGGHPDIQLQVQIPDLLPGCSSLAGDL